MGLTMDRTDEMERKAAPHRKPDSTGTELAGKFRAVTARWILATPEEGKEIHAVLQVMYYGNPSYKYRATVRQSTVQIPPIWKGGDLRRARQLTGVGGRACKAVQPGRPRCRIYRSIDGATQARR
jgi:hypothetical protein